MQRLLPLLLLLLLVLHAQEPRQAKTGHRTGRPAAGRDDEAAPKAGSAAVRGVNGYSQWLVNAALERSPTIVDLVRRLDKTDVVAYVRSDMTGSRFDSYTRLVGVGERRYVMISLSKALRPARKIELLGHELQHVLEIASDPRAKDARGLRALFARLGEEHGYNQFETPQARQAAESVRGEVAQAAEIATAW